ncbi:MAG: ATP-dependent Clp protease adaptor ClpS [Flavobacteriales bacterium]|nr:ATP-dependent Clp protease adaptor ClpS [Flavobacteriales bacterium]
MSDTKEKDQVQKETRLTQDVSARVVLYNDEWHTFEEVIEQIILATGYKTTKAEVMTWEVHTKGKSIIYSGDIDKCLYISSILEQIKLSTQIQY